MSKKLDVELNPAGIRRALFFLALSIGLIFLAGQIVPQLWGKYGARITGVDPISTDNTEIME